MAYEPITYGYYDNYNRRKNRLHRNDILDDLDLLDQSDTLTSSEMDPRDPKYGDAESYQFLKISEGYSSDYSDYSSKNVQSDPPKKDNSGDPQDDSLLQVETEEPDLTLLKDNSPEDPAKVDDKSVTIKPPDLINLYNEVSEIPYGIPRLHHYPLDSRKNCIRAINGIRGCNNIYDRNTLIENLNRINESMGYELTIPNTDNLLLETNSIPWSKMTKKERVQEKLNTAREYLNSLWYFPDGVNDSSIDDYPWLDDFYPNFGRFEFPIRAKYMCGGIYHSDVYDSAQNWFELVNLGNDQGHVEYCKKLYPIIDRLLTAPTLTEEDYDIIMDWRQRICYHYDRLKEETVGSKEYLKEAQYLFDLCWSIVDDPYVEGNIDNARRSFYCRITNIEPTSPVSTDDRKTDEDSELYQKDPVEQYLIDNLSLTGEDYLLPTVMEFPIVNQNSIKLAMDIIDSIPKDQQAEYARNLNRKYDEFHCKFQLCADHPFVRFARGRLKDNVLPILLHDSSTVVDDQGTSDAGSTEPWIRRVDQRGGADSDHEFYPDTELGPNVGKDNQDDFTRHYSIL